MYIRVFSFDFRLKKNVFWKYHENTLCKILDDLKKLLPWQKSIFQKPPKCKMYRIQKIGLESFKLNFFTCG